MNVIRSLLASCRQRAETPELCPDSSVARDPTPSPPPAQASVAADAPPQVARHRLGAPSAAPETYMSSLTSDPLGIVAEYLSPTDQLVMRQVSVSLRATVDPKISTLTLTAQEACALFSQEGDFCHIRTLRLRMCQDADLIRLAAILTAVCHTNFELMLHGHEGCQLSAAGLRALSSLSLASIHLEEIQITPDVAAALSLGASALSLTLPYWLGDQADLGVIGRLVTLQSLRAEKLHVSDDAVTSLHAHASLRELSVASVTANGFRTLVSSPSLHALSVHKIQGNETEAFETLPHNQALSFLRVGRIHNGQSLALLSRHPSLRSIELGLSASACSGIARLAEMSELDHISLVRILSRGRLATEHVEALCTKPLISLGLHCWDMDLSAWEMVAHADTHHLSLDFCDLNNDAIIEAIAENARIKSLSVHGEMINEGNALVLARSPSLEQLKVDFLSEEPDASEERMKNAWCRAGKLLNTLDLSVSRISIDDAEDALTLPW